MNDIQLVFQAINQQRQEFKQSMNGSSKHQFLQQFDEEVADVIDTIAHYMIEGDETLETAISSAMNELDIDVLNFVLVNNMKEIKDAVLHIVASMNN